MNNSQRYDKLRGRATEEKPIDTSMMYGTGQHFSANATRSEEHTSELQSRLHLVCRLLLEKKKKERLVKPVEDYGQVDLCDVKMSIRGSDGAYTRGRHVLVHLNPVDDETIKLDDEPICIYR